MAQHLSAPASVSRQRINPIATPGFPPRLPTQSSHFAPSIPSPFFPAPSSYILPDYSEISVRKTTRLAEFFQYLPVVGVLPHPVSHNCVSNLKPS